MDTSPTALIRVLVPQVPLLLKTALWHSLWLSPTSTKWDLKTELTIRFISALLDSPTPTPVSKQQRLSIKDPGIKGNMWISKVTLPRPEENDLRDALVKAVEDMHEGGEKYTIPDISPVEAEWTGYRSDVHSNRRRPDLSEAQHYEKLMFEVSSPTTILYFHGGAYFLCDPSSHRSTTAKLAHLTRGRCFSVRYRLSPQAAFPAALLDALLAYLSLLYPPPGSLHEPVPFQRRLRRRLCGRQSLHVSSPAHSTDQPHFAFDNPFPRSYSRHSTPSRRSDTFAMDGHDPLYAIYLWQRTLRLPPSSHYPGKGG